MPQNCVKCNNQNAIILVQTNGSFCRNCFEKYFAHKFRAALGKNPVVRHGDKVAVAYSGGNCSSALLHVLIESLSPAAFKKLKFEPGIIFIDETSVLPDGDNHHKVSLIRDLLEKLSMPFHIIKLEEILSIDDGNDSELKELSSSENLKSFFDKIKTLTSKEELLHRIRCKLLAYKALQLGYKHVFLGETSTRLAVNILANIAQGRGAQLASDTRFTDEGRYFGVNLLRPMRNIGAKEIVVYNNLHKVETVCFPTFSTKSKANASIQRLTEDFIVTLCAGFPATETTVFRTSNKLEMAKSDKSVNGKSSLCQLCHGKLDSSASCSSASNAIDFTERLSQGQYGTPNDPKLDCLSFQDGDDVLEDKVGISDSALCHCCRILKRDLPCDTAADSDVIKRVSSATWTQSERFIKEKLNGILIENK